MKKIIIIITILLIANVIFAQNTNNEQIPPNDSTKLINTDFSIGEKISLENEVYHQKLMKYIFLVGFVFSILFLIFILYIYNSKIKSVANLIKIQEREINLKKLEVDKLSLILNQTENAVSLTDADGKIIWANNGFSSLFGKDFEELVGTPDENIFNHATSDALKLQIENCRKSKEPALYSNSFTDEFGSKVWYQRHLIPLVDEKNEIINFAAIDTDLTALKLAMEQINIQKKKVEDQKQKIEASINYASYIQAAVLPPNDFINQLFPANFILYKPRDVVSGDFYWATKLNDTYFIAAADCTGHGVPGAFMSMLGISFLNEIVHDENMEAAEILNRLRDNVIKSLHQTGNEGEQKDGMDIAICSYNKKTKIIQFSGANNPLILIRDKANKTNDQIKEDIQIDDIRFLESEKMPEKILIEIRPNKMPIGIQSAGEQKKFTNRKFLLNANDSLYMHSDGYVDQFGGEKGRKYLVKKYKYLLLEIQNNSLNKQKEILNNEIETWMQHKSKRNKQYEQIDDILVMGVRFAE